MPIRAARQRGAALVIAMLVFALAAALMTAMQSEFTLFIKRGGNIFIAEQTQAYLRGGEDLAIKLLREDYFTDDAAGEMRDDHSEFWAQELPPYTLDEGLLFACLVDQNGRFNLNSLLDGSATTPDNDTNGPRFTENQEMFIRLLQTLQGVEVTEQEAIAVTEAVSDWLDADQNPRNNGGEDGFYYDRSPSYRAANQPMTSISELRSVAGVTADIFRALEPLVTVWTGTTALNINTAPVQVLRSINEVGVREPLSVGEGESLQELRTEGEVQAGYESVELFLEESMFAGKNLGSIKSRLDIKSEYFLFVGKVQVADRTTRLYSVLHRDQNGVKTILREDVSPFRVTALASEETRCATLQ